MSRQLCKRKRKFGWKVKDIRGYGDDQSHISELSVYFHNLSAFIDTRLLLEKYQHPIFFPNIFQEKKPATLSLMLLVYIVLIITKN